MRVNRRVSIWKHVRLADGKWRYCPPSSTPRERLPGHGEVNGSENGTRKAPTASAFIIRN